MKRILLTFALAMFVCGAFAQRIDRLGIEFRGDWQYDSDVSFHTKKRGSASGFAGKFANFRIDGTIADGWSYSFRYRMNKIQANPFAATDWATVTYATNAWEFSAGKQVVAIGGYEYDRAPIDIYFASEYWQNIACYQFGASAAYKFGDSHGSKLLAQICQSPYDFDNEGLYAYNLMYMSDHSLSSVNLLEYTPGKYIGYVALGCREELGDVAIEFDVMDRIDFGNKTTSYSAMLDVKWSINDQFNIFAHGSYDENISILKDGVFMKDPTVVNGVQTWHLGGGVEYFPKGLKDVRLHAASSYVIGNKKQPVGVLRDGDFMFQMGVTWRVNLLGKN